jgi:hypothetical protein
VNVDKPWQTTSSFTFQSISIPGWDLIQTELSQLPEIIQPNKPFWRTKDLDLGLYQKHLPRLWEWFQDMNLDPLYIAYIWVEPHRAYPIHADLGSQDLALQLPVQGCYEVSTSIYISLGEPWLKQIEPTYWCWDRDQVEQIAEYTLEDQPIIFNIKQIHSVVNRTTWTRHALSVRFRTDPWWLLDN